MAYVAKGGYNMYNKKTKKTKIYTEKIIFFNISINF